MIFVLSSDIALALLRGIRLQRGKGRMVSGATFTADLEIAAP
ncbi:hypothetical protein AB3G45_07075 [Shinella sp. S4-D37]